MKAFQLLRCICFALVFNIVMCTASQDVNYAQAKEILQLQPPGEADFVHEKVSSDQERLNTIVRAFQKLPENELRRFGVDLTKSILSGTAEAQELLDAWKRRQQEFKEVVEAIAQPVEHMKIIKSKLENFSNFTTSELIEILTELEYFLSVSALLYKPTIDAMP